MDIVLNPRTKTCTADTVSSTGPRPLSSQAPLTAPLQRSKPGRGCLSVLIPPPKAWPRGMEGSRYLCVEHILVIISQLQPGPALCKSRTVTLSFRQLLQRLFSIFPAPIQPAAWCCVPGTQPSIRPFLTRSSVRISCSKQFLCLL